MRLAAGFIPPGFLYEMPGARGELLGTVPRDPAPGGPGEQRRDPADPQPTGQPAGSVDGEAGRRSVVIGKTRAERKTSEHAIASALELAFAPRRAVREAAADPAFHEGTLDEPSACRPGGPGLADCIQDRRVGHEAQLQSFRRAPGAAEVIQDPADLLNDSLPPGGVVVVRRQGCEAAQGQPAVLEDALAQVARPALGDQENPALLRAEEREKARARDRKGVDSGHRHPVFAQDFHPGLDPFRPDDGGEEDPVVSASLARAPLAAGEDVGSLVKQPGASGREDGPAGGTEHVGSGLAAKVLLDHVRRGDEPVVPDCVRGTAGVRRSPSGPMRSPGPAGAPGVSPGTGAPRRPGPEEPSARSPPRGTSAQTAR